MTTEILWIAYRYRATLQIETGQTAIRTEEIHTLTMVTIHHNFIRVDGSSQSLRQAYQATCRPRRLGCFLKVDSCRTMLMACICILRKSSMAQTRSTSKALPLSFLTKTQLQARVGLEATFTQVEEATTTNPCLLPQSMRGSRTSSCRGLISLSHLYLIKLSQGSKLGQVEVWVLPQQTSTLMMAQLSKTT